MANFFSVWEKENEKWGKIILKNVFQGREKKKWKREICCLWNEMFLKSNYI